MADFTPNINKFLPGTDVVITQVGSTNTGGPYYADYTFYAKDGLVQGVNTPNYTKKKKMGFLLPHTPWIQKEAQEIVVTPGQWYTEYASNPSVWARWDPLVNFLPSEYSPPAADTSGADYMLQKAAAEIYAQGWDALTFASELPKTVDMINGFGKKLQNLSRGLSRKRILNAWIEGRYGWRTLAYDARDIANSVTLMNQQRTIWSERQGFSTSFNSVSDSIVSSYTNNWATVTETVTGAHSIRGAISAKIDVSAVRLNPFETAWELVPLSFVLDWVYDIGTSIRALSFSAVASEYTSSIGVSTEYVADYTTAFGDNESNRQNGVWTGGVTFSGKDVERIPIVLNYHPQVTRRLLTSDLILDLRAIAESRNYLSSRR